MIPLGPRSRQARVHLLLFANFALALQNVTVDDAALTGAVVPQYLPTNSVWNIGNTCTGCLVQPDPSLAYDGTWHDVTYSGGNGFTPAIEFSYTGSAIYVFFILANYVPYATTFTGVDFVLDNVLMSTYTHQPSNSTNYQYNVPVYANSSVAYGEHNVIIQPVTNSGNVLILFDYLIYTTDTSSSVLLSATTTTSASTLAVITTSAYVTALPTQTSSGTGASSKPNIGAIAGGTVGGVVALVLVATSWFCYRRYKRGNSGRPSTEEGAVVEPFIVSGEVSARPLTGTTSQYPVGLSVTNPTLRSKTSASSVTTLPQSIPPASTAISSSATPSSNNAAILEQVELLRDEVARLRNMQDSNRNSIGAPSEAPPEYSS